MTPEDYQRAGDVFERVRNLPEPERTAVLDSTCGGNAELRAQVARLVEADREVSSGSFLERRAIEDAARLLTPIALDVPASGTVIGNYRLGKRIGAGGMGVVFEAQDLHLPRRVAIKVLPVAFEAEREERVQRFQREARAVCLLNHPNIVSIFDADFDHGHCYIAMEFIEGKTLRQLIASEAGNLDANAILDLIGQAASALSAAHAAGIVHRDIKPENIMVRPDGFVKVLDFGLAKLLDPAMGPEHGPPDPGTDLKTRPGNLAGTIQYLSPEQVLGQPAGPRSDLFSLGVVAYELATGERPFDGPSDGAVFNAILNRTPPPPSAVRPGFGDELDGLITRAIEKDPELRFQTAGDLRSTCRRLSRDRIVKAVVSDREIREQPATGGSKEAQIATQPWRAPSGPIPQAIQAKTARVRRFPLLAIVAGLLVSIGAAFFWMTRPLPPPRVTRIAQITSDGLYKQFFVNDGTRLYYSAGNADPDAKMFQVSVKGGEPVPMPRLTGMFPFDISPDHSEMLLAQYLKGTTQGPYPVWVADTLGSPPRRVGNLTADYACWSPQGDEILYVIGPDLRIAHGDGSESRKLVTVKGIPKFPAWSPDGRSIRFTLLAKNSEALWEVAADGSGLHALFPEWAGRPHDRGVWTPDGRYFLFTSWKNTHDLWVVRQSRRLFARSAPSPVQLTNGPMVAYRSESSPDGRRIFFLGGPDRGELVRYDRRLDEWVPYLGGVAAVQLDYSRDGKWVTYATSPGGTVWRSALDGSQLLQLTAPPLFARNPRWSPDGSQITFYGGVPGKPDRVYLVPAAGGAVQELTHGSSGPSGDTDGSFSADGALLVFGSQSADQHGESRALEIVDVKTQRVTPLPQSQGLWSPRWSPDGRYIAALGFPNRLWIYEVRSGARTQLTTFGVGYPGWSRDSQYLYFEDNSTTVWYRVGIKDRRVERLASLKSLKMAPSGLGWIGLTPEGSLISSRDAGSTELYALDWEAP